MGRRKHHCRSCGGIFCSACSNQFKPVPSEQLYDPVRVCDGCGGGGGGGLVSTNGDETVEVAEEAIAAAPAAAKVEH